MQCLGALVVNISMHECHDLDRVTANVRAALEPGGWFVILLSRHGFDDIGSFQINPTHAVTYGRA